MSVSLACLMMASFVTSTEGHAFLNIPMARRLTQLRSSYTSITAFGAGQPITNCGKRDLSKSSVDDTITELKAGAISKFQIGVDVHHAGHLEMYLCPFVINEDFQDISKCSLMMRATAEEAGIKDCDDDDTRDICADVDPQNPGWWYLGPKNPTNKFHDMWFHVPTMECPGGGCTVQFTWKTANSCNPHPKSYCPYYNRMQGPQRHWCQNYYCSGICNQGEGPDDCDATMAQNEVDRKCCSEVFTNCAQVSLLAPEALTFEPDNSESDEIKIGNSSLSTEDVSFHYSAKMALLIVLFGRMFA